MIIPRYTLLLGIALLIPIPDRTSTTFDPCAFDRVTHTFRGSPSEQAECLLRFVEPYGRVRAAPRSVPPALGELLDSPISVSKTQLRTFLQSHGIDEADVGGSLDQGVSVANLASRDHPGPLYFVIHDTSSPYLGSRPFPEDMDSPTSRVNDLSLYPSDPPDAHVFVGRDGGSRTVLDLSVAWRATKLEMELGPASRGRFIHIENVQPRRRDPNGPEDNDALSPAEAFTIPQLDRLALVYLAASVRAGRWLVPAFHSVVDNGIEGAHDDPQGFDLALWASRMEMLMDSVR